jgi:hypothetical protein
MIQFLTSMKIFPLQIPKNFGHKIITSKDLSKNLKDDIFPYAGQLIFKVNHIQHDVDTHSKRPFVFFQNTLILLQNPLPPLASKQFMHYQTNIDPVHDFLGKDLAEPIALLHQHLLHAQQKVFQQLIISADQIDDNIDIEFIPALRHLGIKLHACQQDIKLQAKVVYTYSIFLQKKPA